MVDIENIVCIKLFGEGYYSGQCETQIAFVTKNFYNKYKNFVEDYTPYFCELDGKHSQVQGETTVIFDDMYSCFKEYLNQSDEDWMIWEEMLSSEEIEPLLLEEQQKLNKTIQEQLKKKVEVHYYFNGEEI